MIKNFDKSKNFVSLRQVYTKKYLTNQKETIDDYQYFILKNILIK